MSNLSKNLEAQNEIYKGVLRTPIAFLVGGPIGLITNIVYTITKTNHEISRETEHKKYLHSIGINNIDAIQDGKIRLQKIEAKKAQEKEDEISYLKNEFENSEDPSFNEGCWINYSTKKLMYENMHYSAIIHVGRKIDEMWGGRYLPIKEFIDQYKTDLSANNIEKKYRFYNNNIRITFGYRTNDNFFFTGMFTRI